MPARDENSASGLSWKASKRVLDALELEGVGIVQLRPHRARGKWYAFTCNSDETLGPFNSVEDAKRAVEESRDGGRGKR